MILVVAALGAGVWWYVKQPHPVAPPQETTYPLPTGAMLETADIDPIDTDVQVMLKTTKGDIALLLHGAAAPITVGNFVKLADDNFYDGVIFHRVIPDFMIQGGDPTGTGTGGPGYTFEDEINPAKVVRGAVAMANAGPGTNGSQFFIVTGAAFPHLDGKHTVFGEVTSGMDVVDAISKVPVDANDKPLEPVTIQDVVVDSSHLPSAPSPS